MSRRFWIGLTITLSVLWAVGVWAGYQLLLLSAGLVEQSSVWWAAYPEVQSVLQWLGAVAAGMEGVLRVVVIAGWALGQLCLLVMLWLGMRFGTHTQVQAWGRQLQQRAQSLTGSLDGIRR